MRAQLVLLVDPSDMNETLDIFRRHCIPIENGCMNSFHVDTEFFYAFINVEAVCVRAGLLTE